MNKYLEKIAKEYSDDRYNANRLAAAGHFFTGDAAAVAGNHLGIKPITKALGQTGSVDKSTLRKILKDNKDLDVTFSAHKAAKGTRYNASSLKIDGIGPYFMDRDNKNLSKGPLGKNYIHGAKTKNLDFIVHEIGHAKAISQGKYQMSAASASQHLGTGSLLGTAMLAHPATAGAAWVAPLAASAPGLYSEGLANHNGYKMIAKHGGKPMANRFLRGVAAKNMLGYASAGLANSAYLYGLHRLAKSSSE